MAEHGERCLETWQAAFKTLDSFQPAPLIQRDFAVTASWLVILKK